MCGSRQFLSERGPTITAFFLCLFLNDDERLDPDTTIYIYKRAIVGPPAKRHLNGVKWRFAGEPMLLAHH